MTDETPEDANVIHIGDFYTGVKQDPAKMLRKIAKLEGLSEAYVIYRVNDNDYELETTDPDLLKTQGLFFNIAIRISLIGEEDT